MLFHPDAYGDSIAKIFRLADAGQRLMPLVSSECTFLEARQALANSTAKQLFPNSRAPECALAGLWVYLSCFEEAHALAQDIPSPEGSYWHAILHRQEPDSGNAAYWFRRVGTHPVFPSLHNAATEITERYPDAGFRPGSQWDPFSFISFCERAREQPRSASEQAALEIQRAEWQLLFDYCAEPGA